VKSFKLSRDARFVETTALIESEPPMLT